MEQFYDGYGYHQGTSFEQIYRCYPAAFIEKSEIESGDKIIMPPSALQRLASLHIDYPMLFELKNGASGRVSHCGVLEFIADEGTIYMPYWMMQNLLLQEGDTLRVKNVSLPKGTYVKLQPHTKDFMDISNPKAILETTLRKFSCLSTGDTIMVEYNNKKYYLDVIETKAGGNAISIIDTDCEVDFAPPLDYKPERPIAHLPPGNTQDKAKLNSFSGTGRRLDGKPTAAVNYSSGPVDKRINNNVPNVSSSPINARLTSQGRVVFGSDVYRTQETGKERILEPSPQKQSKFLPFIGKKYSLRG